MQIRMYGVSGPVVVVLHGGPGAIGYMAPVGRGLADSFRVLEPFQRGSGGEPLTVAQHITDLHGVVKSQCGPERPAIVGSSWGAMLALAYAAAHPDSAGPLVLIGCGTFDEVARERVQRVIDERMGEALRRHFERLPDEFPDPNERLRMMSELILPLYSCELATTDQEIEICDARAYEETWTDMVRLQNQGVYPTTFAAIHAPVLMLHGQFDPHPGRMILASLKPHIQQLEYVEFESCGHYPWLEKAARDKFFSVLRGWLSRTLSDSGGHPRND